MRMEINLLPHREARRAADVRESIGLLLLGLVLIGGGVFFLNQKATRELHVAEETIAQLEANIARYKPQQELVTKFKKQKKQLQDKLDVIGSLEQARTGPVRVLDELASSVPDRLWLTKLETKGRSITIEGESIDTGVVADFLRSLNASPFFENVDLDKTSGGKVVDGISLVNFAIRADMASPVEEIADAS